MASKIVTTLELDTVPNLFSQININEVSTGLSL